jgi:hypothetical protein
MRWKPMARSQRRLLTLSANVFARQSSFDAKAIGPEKFVV